MDETTVQFLLKIMADWARHSGFLEECHRELEKVERISREKGFCTMTPEVGAMVAFARKHPLTDAR